jgi:hypothetical protein
MRGFPLNSLGAVQMMSLNVPAIKSETPFLLYPGSVELQSIVLIQLLVENTISNSQ